MTSEVISFRLDDTIPEEAAALALLRGWQADGHTTRAIMALAIRALEHSRDTENLVTELRLALVDARGLAETIQAIPLGAPPSRPALQERSSDTDLSDQFMAAVKAAARPGRRRG